MTNAQTVFETAMALMDELSQNGGQADTADNKEYKDRSLAILNALSGELYPYSDSFRPEQHCGRPVVPVILDFSSSIGLDDYICRSVLPYGLAAQLLLSEDPEASSFCQLRYERLKAGLETGLPAQAQPIQDVYGGIEYGEFSCW